MPDINYLAVLVAIVAAFVLSGLWYGALGGRLASLHEAYATSHGSQLATMFVELARNVVVAFGMINGPQIGHAALTLSDLGTVDH